MKATDSKPAKLPQDFLEVIQSAFSNRLNAEQILALIQEQIEDIGWDNDGMYGDMFTIERDEHHRLLMRIGYTLKELETNPQLFIQWLGNELHRVELT